MSTNWRLEWKPLAVIAAAFMLCFCIPVEALPFENALTESLYLVREYARLHVLTCLVPAFFIAGAIAVFVSQAAVIKYFGVRANKVLAYGVASVSGTILAVCSCTVLPLFAGIYKGLHLLDVIPLTWSGPGQMGRKGKGLLAALVLGLLFGVALGPCTFAYMAPVLAVTFKLAATGFAYAMLLLLAFAMGHCSVIVVAGTSTGLVQRYLNWNERTSGACILRRICGVLLLLGGIYLVYVAV